MNKDQKQPTESARVVRQAKARRPEGRLLSHRVQFVSLQQEAEDHAPFVARALHVSDVDTVVQQLCRFGSSLLFHTSFALQTASEKAVSEAISLIQDPDYYQTVKERRRRWRARRMADEATRLEQRRNPPKPTLEQVQREIKQARADIERYIEWGASSSRRLQQLQETEAELLSEIETDEAVM